MNGASIQTTLTDAAQQRPLRIAEEALRQYFELPLIGIAITSLDKGWLEVNDKLCEILGYSREQLVVRTWAEITHPEDLAADVAQFERVVAGEIDGYSLDKRFIRPDGRIVYASISARCVRHASGSIDYFVALVQDITERKLAEEQIRGLNSDLEQRVIDRTAELEIADRLKDEALARAHAARVEAEAANRLKDEFLSVLSHELRTPLNAILGWSRLLRSGQLDPENQQKALEIIERNALAQNRLIEDLLDISRIIQGKLHLQKRMLDLQTLVQAALDTVDLAAQSREIEIVAHLAAEPVFLEGDASRLQQIVLNLLTNAIKFTQPGGRVEVTLEPADTRVALRVSDTGIGISPEFLPHLFDRFRQAEAAAHRQGGLGLGLAIVRHIVELHQGTIWAESEGVGKGSTFTVVLPLPAEQHCLAQSA